MFLICLSGTLVVFYEEFERWEQPDVVESPRFDPATIERAYAGFVESGVEVTHHMFVSLPQDGMPRTLISSEKEGRFINPDGSLGSLVEHEWTHLLVNLHIYLHLPQTFGMIVVSALGALLVGLIVSGLLAHPRIFKDAFALRLRGSGLLEQADIHNRLSVWSTPFQLMIAITGAYFGMTLLLSLAMSQVYFDGSKDALMARVFGAEPELEQAARPLAIEKALTQMRTIAPDARPFYLTVEEADVPEKQYMIVGAELPGRLIYAEQYRFDAAGSYLGKVGFSDGEAGRQALYSVYRLHFGHFGNFGIKVLYGILGLAMTVVCVTGFNIWLARRKRRDHWNHLWAGFVWGAAPALASAAVAQVIFGVPALPVFWAVMLGATALALWWQNERASKSRLEIAGAAIIGMLIASHIIKFGPSAFNVAAAWVNACFALIALTLLLTGLFRMRQAEAATRLQMAIPQKT